MKRIVSCIVLGFGFVSNAFAGSAAAFSTFQINWSSPVATAVPTMSTYGTLLLAVLLALVVYRVLRNRGSLVRALVPLATFGIAAAFTVMTEDPEAGIAPPPINGASCNGSATYTANPSTSPPCFINSCGSPVTISYTFISGVASNSTPLTAGTCTTTYHCNGGVADGLDGMMVPSDGRSYATAFCSEINGGA